MDLSDRDDLRSHLQSTLGGAYTLERELGGGGMSRVFVAEETRFRRRVVIKLLPPELAAGLLLDRFEREVTFAARLQHPNIVPVLNAGEVDGLPYFTMPFVDGPSLRSKLRANAPGSTRLSLAEAVGILRDVAKALAYAHGQGIVHRDIKPENVLLNGDTALVTDFGIAKALEAAATTQPSRDGSTPHPTASTLTAQGSWLGTPGYMAPEQALGESADARADLYAWGVLAYELLAGVHPFADRRTPQQLVAAHIGETPPALGRLAPDVPPALATLVMRCLTKDPSARPPSADELLETLARNTGVPAMSGRVTRRRRWRQVAGLSLAVVAALVLGGWLLTPAEARLTLRTLLTRAPATLRVNRVVVAPFKDETRVPGLASLGSLTADYITEGLSRLGSIQVVDTRTAAQTSEFVQRIPRFLRSDDERALGQETGAKVVVAGTYYVIADSLVIRARILDAETGAIRTSIDPVAAPAGQPTKAVGLMSARVVAALRAASDEDAPDLAGLSSPPSLEAYAAFHDAYRAFIVGLPDTQFVPSLLKSMALDTTYAAPAVLLAFVMPDRRLAGNETAIGRARRFGDRLTKQERALLDLTEANGSGDLTRALDAAQRTGVPLLIANTALLARRPRTALAALLSTDPDRGMNILTGGLYWTRRVQANAQIGAYDDALVSLREGRRRVAALRTNVMLELSVLGARGDSRAVHDKLESLWSAGNRNVSPAIEGTALLRMRGGREVEGRAIAEAWVNRFLRDDTALPPGEEIAMIDLLASLDRWDEALRVIERFERSQAADSGGTTLPWYLDEWPTHTRLRRAVALAHLGRRPEALAIDSQFTTLQSQARVGVGFTMARAVLQAHLGAVDSAMNLLTRGVEHGGLTFFGADRAVSVGTLYDMILFRPLLSDERFRMLADPDPADR